MRRTAPAAEFAVAKRPGTVYSAGVKSAANFALVLVTAPDAKTARRLATSALRARLIACANLIPVLESRYWWQGRIEHNAEVLLALKTTRARLARLQQLVVAEHPYETPEFIVLPLTHGNRRYLDWIEASCRPARQKR